MVNGDAYGITLYAPGTCAPVDEKSDDADAVHLAAESENVYRLIQMPKEIAQLDWDVRFPRN